MEKVTDFFDTWFKSQEKFIENWMETSKKMQQSILKPGMPGEGIKETVDIAADTASKLFSSPNVCMKLTEIWLPLLDAIRERTGDIDSYMDLFDPVKYKEVMDQIFGLSSPETMAEFYEQAAKLLQTFGTSTMGFMGPWTEAMQKNLKILPQFAEGHPESFMNIFHNMFNSFDSTFGKVFHIPAVGKDREKVELILKGLDDVSVYLAKNTEHQQIMYVTGLAAMEQVVETIAKKVRDGKEVKDFSEFFNLWIEVNEKAYYALFQTEEFSKLQGELLESTLTVRKHFFKLMELYLYDFPIALRSEMDDLYKTIYDLKNKVKSLEKQMKNLSVEEVTA